MKLTKLFRTTKGGVKGLTWRPRVARDFDTSVGFQFMLLLFCPMCI